MRWLLLLAALWCTVGSAFAAAPGCSVRPGQGSALLITATILAPARAIPQGEVLVATDGTIGCVGRAGVCARRFPAATRLRCPGMVLSPGLINTHDHIAFTGIAPRPDTGERYEHRHEWRKGLDGHHALESFTAEHDPLLIGWGELRFLVGGTTATVGGDMAPGLLRNLDVAAGLEGLRELPVTYRIFPLDDAAGLMREHDCDYGPHPATAAEVANTHAFLAHVSEGRDEAARNEFRCESSRRYDTTPAPNGGGTSADWIMPRATLIHAVALTPADLALVARRGAAIVWSPRSNLSLYGTTLDVLRARRLGIPVALGSDWLPSGSMNLNRELACALRYDHAHLHDALDTRALWRMVTADAARAVHDEDRIGSIRAGHVADLALFMPRGRDPYAAVVRSTPLDTALVLRGGTVLFGVPPVVDALRPGCETIDVAGRPRRLCSEPGRATAAALTAFAAERHLYPLAFDGLPENEPSCDVPSPQPASASAR